MLKKLLPKELWKTKINTENYRCSYDFKNDIVNFNRTYLLNDEDILKATKIVNPTVKTKKDYLIFCLLHELGHRYFKNLFCFNEYRIQSEEIFRKYHHNEITRQIKYWENIPSEKIAEDFAKHFFKLYKEKQIKNEKI
jgi:nuclear transport factor 2 (NTF2) superfamily protein